MMSGFFSSLSLPSSSRLAILLSLGPGEPSPVVVPWDSSLRLNRFRLRCRHGSRSTITISNAATKNATDKPIMTGSVGVNGSGLRGRSTWAKQANIGNGWRDTRKSDNHIKIRHPKLVSMWKVCVCVFYIVNVLLMQNVPKNMHVLKGRLTKDFRFLVRNEKQTLFK